MPASGITPDGAAADTGVPVIAAAGDIACDPGFTYFNNGLGTASRCRQKYTSDLLVNAGLAAVLPLGDIQYDCGSATEFARSYHLSWGRVKAITRPAIGNHEYHTTGGTGCSSSANGGGYFGYFGAAAGTPGKGYYSYDIGAWHLIALNSNCSFVSCGSSSAQAQWLRADLAAHPARCTLGYWHHPRFTSGTNSPGSNSVTPLYQALYDHGADVVLVGHDHHYERFAPQSPSGGRDLARGIRQFLVGTGGRGFHPIKTALSEQRGPQQRHLRRAEADPTPGELRLAVRAGGRQELQRCRLAGLPLRRILPRDRGAVSNPAAPVPIRSPLENNVPSLELIEMLETREDARFSAPDLR